MVSATGPSRVVWDITYGCPLRCVHCYSESGRRPTRQLGLADQFAVADAMISWAPRGVTLAGGEPLSVRGIDQLAQRFSAAGISVCVYTSGWFGDRIALDRIADVFDRIVVSLDGPTAPIHDSVRGRAGSFDRAIATLSTVNDIIHERRRRGKKVPSFGIDCVVLRSNFDALTRFCTEIVPRFDELRSIYFGAVVPGGLANRADFAEQELLDDRQLRELASLEYRSHLQSLVPSGVQVGTSDNLVLMMHPYDPVRGAENAMVQVEPDGEVRAMPVYEGTVGSLLTDAPGLLWQRVVGMRSAPFVIETLSPVRTMSEWAAAGRLIDRHFGSERVRDRIDRRPAYLSPLAESVR